MRIDFYKMKIHTVEEVIEKILQKQLDNNGKTLILTTEKMRMSEISTFLWTHLPNHFFPNGTENEKYQELQPIYLTTHDENKNHADLLILIDGADSVHKQDFKRCLYFSTDEQSHEKAINVFKEALAEKWDIYCWEENDSGKWQSASEP